MRNKKKKKRENTRQRKKTITRTRQYLRGSVICLHLQSCRDFIIIKEEYNMCNYNIFSLYKTRQHQNPNNQIAFSTPNRSKKIFFFWIYRPKPPLHELSFSKSPIKNHIILFGSGQVIKPDQIKLDSTKPNILCVFNRYINIQIPTLQL